MFCAVFPALIRNGRVWRAAFSVLIASAPPRLDTLGYLNWLKGFLVLNQEVMYLLKIIIGYMNKAIAIQPLE